MTTTKRGVTFCTKQDLVNSLIHLEGLNQFQASRILDVLFQRMACELLAGHHLELPGIGALNISYQPASIRPTANGEQMIEAVYKLRVVATRKFKDILNRYGLIKQQQREEEYKKEFPITQQEVAFDYNKTKNSPHKVRRSLIEYLSSLGSEYYWQHPVSKEVYSPTLIREKLLALKKINPDIYQYLYYLWFSRLTREECARRFLCSASTVKRKWDVGIDCLLILLLCPELEAPLVMKSLNND